MSTVRSVLCVPGHDARKVSRCRDWGADQILFDLEDAVPEDRKSQALELVCKAVKPADAVRVCAPSHPLHRAQLLALRDLVVTIWVPKVEDADTMRALWWPESAWAIIESPLGVINAHAIARESFGLAFGRWDFMASTGIADPWGQLVNHAMGQVSMAAHAAGIPASDAPCYKLYGGDTMVREVARAKSYGYSSKGCVHPAQIPYCAELAPSHEELTATSQLAAGRSSVCRVGELLAGPPMAKLAERLSAL